MVVVWDEDGGSSALYLPLCLSVYVRAGSGRSGRSCEPFFSERARRGAPFTHRPMPFCLMQAGNTRPGLVLGWQLGAAPEQAATWGLLLFMRGVAPSRRHLYSYRSRSYLRYASHAVQYMYSGGHRIDVATGPQPTVALRLRSHAIVCANEASLYANQRQAPFHVNFVFEANPCHDYVR